MVDHGSGVWGVAEKSVLWGAQCSRIETQHHFWGEKRLVCEITGVDHAVSQCIWPHQVLLVLIYVFESKLLRCDLYWRGWKWKYMHSLALNCPTSVCEYCTCGSTTARFLLHLLTFLSYIITILFWRASKQVHWFIQRIHTGCSYQILWISQCCMLGRCFISKNTSHAPVQFASPTKWHNAAHGQIAQHWLALRIADVSVVVMMGYTCPSALRRKLVKPRKEPKLAKIVVLLPQTSLLHNLFAKFSQQHVHIVHVYSYLITNRQLHSCVYWPFKRTVELINRSL